jgi:hypothetical protein
MADDTKTETTAAATGTTVAVKTNDTTTASVSTTTSEPVLYFGPNVISAGLLTNQVYKNGIPDAAKQLQDTYSLILQLFAPAEQAIEMKQAVNTKGTVQYIAANQIRGDKN